MSNWNRSFTDQIRQSRWALWGNWSLDDQIQPGTVGTMTPDGNFAAVGKLSGLPITDQVHGTKWQVATSTVGRKAFDASASASGGGASVTASGSVGVTWTFQSADTLTSEFALSKESSFDVVPVLGQNLAAIKDMANQVGMLVDGKIAQGFGVITSVLYATSGVNVGALSAGSSFTLSGSAEGVASMLGNAKGSASYSSTDETSATDHHLWPAVPGTAVTDMVPIAYSFASFQDDIIIPNWTQPITSLRVIIQNDVGCTYITKATIRYSSAQSGGAQSREITVTGGTNGTMDIPLDAQSLNIDLHFVGSSDTLHVTSAAPLGQWPTGQCVVDVWGVWPGGAHSKVTYP